MQGKPFSFFLQLRVLEGGFQTKEEMYQKPLIILLPLKCADKRKADVSTFKKAYSFSSPLPLT